MNDSEITEENLAAMEEKLAQYTALQKALEENHALTDASLQITVALQEELRHAQTEMNRCQKEAWEFEPVSTCRNWKKKNKPWLTL